MVYVIDSSDRERIARSKGYLLRVLNDADLKDAPILVMANKQDIEGAMSGAELAEKLDL